MQKFDSRRAEALQLLEISSLSEGRWSISIVLCLEEFMIMVVVVIALGALRSRGWNENGCYEEISFNIRLSNG